MLDRGPSRAKSAHCWVRRGVPLSSDEALTGMRQVIEAMGGFGAALQGVRLDDLQGFAAAVLPIYPAWFVN
jgi:hypothetical protein